MDALLEKARACHDEAERYQLRASMEDDDRQRRVILDIAEHFYLLHDSFVELGGLITQDEVVRLKR